MIRVDKQVNQSCKREFSDGPLIRTPSFLGEECSILVGELRFSKLHSKKKTEKVAEYKVSIPKSALFLCTSSKQTEN